GQPVLGVRLQRGRHPGGSRRAAQPDARRGRDGLLLGVRGDQQPAAAPVPLRGGAGALTPPAQRRWASSCWARLTEQTSFTCSTCARQASTIAARPRTAPAIAVASAPMREVSPPRFAASTQARLGSASARTSRPTAAGTDSAAALETPTTS